MKRASCLITALVLLLIILMPNSLADEEGEPVIISSGQYEKGFRYNIQGWVYIHIEGEPYERGYQYGYLASSEIVDMIYRWSEYGKSRIKIISLFYTPRICLYGLRCNILN